MIINVYKDGRLFEKLALQRPPTVGETYDECNCRKLVVKEVRENVRPIEVDVEEEA